MDCENYCLNEEDSNLIQIQIQTLVLVSKKKESKEKTKFDSFYSSSKSEIIIDESDIDNVFKSIYNTVISNIQKIFGKRLRFIDSVIDYTISVSRYNTIAIQSIIQSIVQ